MDFNDNPFYLLKAKTTDDKKKLLKLAEESLINNDSSKINSARLILSNPKKRIFAECSWFLGEDNKNLDRSITTLVPQNIPIIYKQVSFDEITKVKDSWDSISCGDALLNADMVHKRNLVNLGISFQSVSDKFIDDGFFKSRCSTNRCVTRMSIMNSFNASTCNINWGINGCLA